MTDTLPFWLPRPLIEPLCASLDLSEATLRHAADQAQRRDYQHSTQRGRALRVPRGALYTLQSQVLHRLLRTAPIPSAAHGAVAGRSIFTHAAAHLPQAQEILTMDLANAFGSVRRALVRDALRRAFGPMWREQGLDARERRQVARALAHLTTTEDQLPAGAPSSAALLNLVAAPLDRALERLIASLPNQARYSRYLDDLTFSARTGPLPQEFPASVERAIRTHLDGRANRAKTRRLSRQQGATLSIMGLIHDGRGWAFSPEHLRQLITDLQTRRQAAGTPARLSPASRRSMEGSLSFARQVYATPQRLPRDLAAVTRWLAGGDP